MKLIQLTALSLSLSWAAAAWSNEHDLDDGDRAAAEKISAQLEEFAGSPENADALAEGLRNGTEFTLTEQRPVDDGTEEPPMETVEVMIDPSTDAMGNGEILITARLAERLLADAELESTLENIAVVLEGGNVLDVEGEVMVTYSGILMDRAAGMGWGEIANAAGFRLGEVMSAMRSSRGDKPEKANGNAKDRVASVDRVEMNRPERSEKAVRPERPDRPERPVRPDRPERPARPEMPERPGVI